MRVYLDVSCLNRPFDDQRQPRIHLEAESILFILSRIEEGRFQNVSSEMAEIEIDAIEDPVRWRRVRELLPDPADIIALTPKVLARASRIEVLGFSAADAVHIAAAESARADVLLTCDDRLKRRAARLRRRLRVRIDNPIVWLEEQDDAHNG